MVAGYFVWKYYSVRVSTDDAQINGHLIPISARVGGYVQEVCVNENQPVKAGEILFEIDPADYRVAVERATADLAQARAEARGARTAVPIASATTGSQLATAQAAEAVAQAGVGGAQKKLDAARAQVSAARAQVQQREANATRTAQDLKRYRALVAKDEISRQQFDAAVAAERAAVAAADAAKAAVNAQNQEIAVAESQLAQAQCTADAGASRSQSCPHGAAAGRGHSGKRGVRPS